MNFILLRLRYEFDTAYADTEIIIFLHVQGKLSDIYGRKNLLLLSCIGPFLGYIVIGLSTSLMLLIISRILHGIT